jgi:hypothetical protein
MRPVGGDPTSRCGSRPYRFFHSNTTNDGASSIEQPYQLGRDTVQRCLSTVRRRVFNGLAVGYD